MIVTGEPWVETASEEDSERTSYRVRLYSPKIEQLGEWRARGAERGRSERGAPLRRARDPSCLAAAAETVDASARGEPRSSPIEHPREVIAVPRLDRESQEHADRPLDAVAYDLDVATDGEVAT
jgi:hypothetical protein